MDLTDRGNVARDEKWRTSVDGVYTAGDMQHGQSLIVWAIAEGRSAAAAIDEDLMGQTDLRRLSNFSQLSRGACPGML